MHFEFSDSTHQWCNQCGANVRKNASWCRFCHRNIASTLLPHGENIDPSMIIDGAACWLPKFDELVARCGSGLQERFRQADLASIQRFHEADSAYLAKRFGRRSADICSEFPPEPRIAGLLLDILLNLHECGENLARLCDDPRLVLIEHTAASITHEAEVRILEESSGEPCEFCGEHILTAEACCRFCTSDGHEPPAQLDFRQFEVPLDSELLASVVLWEAARLQADSEPSLPPALLEAYSIGPERTELEMARQSREPQSFPVSLWRRRMFELRLKTQRSHEALEIQDLICLASACAWKDKQLEAEVVYRHGLRRLKDHSQLLSAKNQILDGLSLVYFSRGDYEKYQQLKGEADQLRMSMLPPEMRKLSAESDKDMLSMMERISRQEELDPRAQIEQVEARLKKLDERQAQLIRQTSSPEIRKLLEEQQKRLRRVAGPGMDIQKLRVDAQDAKKEGDFQKATGLLQQALSKVGEERNDVITRSAVLLQLAEIQSLQGNPDIADCTYLHAISVAEKLSELNDGSEQIPLCQVCMKYASFLMQCERYSEAEQNLVRALEMDNKFQEGFARDFRRGVLAPSEIEAEIKTALANLMRRSNRIAAAEQAEAQAADIRKEVAKLEQRRANGRRNFLEMASDGKAGQGWQPPPVKE